MKKRSKASPMGTEAKALPIKVLLAQLVLNVETTHYRTRRWASKKTADRDSLPGRPGRLQT
jgi:hypothetical protein